MIVALWIGIGIVLSSVLWMALPLAEYVDSMQDEAACGACKDRDNCFALKEIKLLDSNYVSEFMLISYLRVKEYCPLIKGCTIGNKLKCFAVSFIIFIIPFWSRGMGVDGLIMGISAISLLFLSIVDWKTQYIPLEMSGVILVCGLIQLFADLSNWLEYVIGLIAVSGFLYIADKIGTYIYNASHGGSPMVDNVIGDGDIKLMAATGLLLGWKLNILALIVGCMAGSVIHLVLMKLKKGERQLALGPYLSLGVYITMICGEQLVSWYLSMVGIVPIN